MKSLSRLLLAAFGAGLPLALSSCTGSGVQFELDHDPTAVQVVDQGWRVESSLTLEDGEYLCAPRIGPSVGDLESAAVVIDGKRDVVLDLRGVVLRGAEREASPDKLRGIGVLVRDCENVRILGGTLGGYRVPVRILRSRGVLIDGTNFDGWYADSLGSTPRREDPLDEIRLESETASGRFERYAAAIAVSESTRVTVRGCRGRHGQNGILLETVHDSLVIDSDFSFLSGWGCALFDSSGNQVSHNVFDYCVRGFSKGIRAGGQGSAGILLGGKSRENIVAECSATHCGDGLRIAALQSEGSGQNSVFSCDFSYATSCGVRIDGPSAGDRFFSNQLSGAYEQSFTARGTNGLVCHDNVMSSARLGGLRLTESDGSLISDNVIEDTECGISIEPSAAGASGGEDHWLIHNVLSRNLEDLRLRSLKRVRLERNRFESPAGRLVLSGLLDDDLGAVIGEREALARIMGRFDVPPAGVLKDLSLAPAEAEVENLQDSRTAYLEGKVSTPSLAGRRSTRASDRGFEQRDHASILLGPFGPWDFRAEDSKPKDPGSTTGPLRTARWQASWFHWDASRDPRGDLERWRALRFDPVLEKSFEGNGWAGPYGAGLGAEHKSRIGYERFGLIAEATIQVSEPGRYRFEVISDDGVRVWIDGEPVIENWTWHPRTVDSVEVDLTAGEHNLKLEYFQIDGASALALDLEPIHRARHRGAEE